MKIKLWQWEFEFDKEDAMLVFPLILLLLGLFFTHLNREVLWGGGVVYYLLYFLLKPALLALNELSTRIRQRMLFRCPYCKSREVVMQGYQGFRGSDEQYAYHICNRCRETSILVNERLLKG
jgi:hypothetical protein